MVASATLHALRHPDARNTDRSSTPLRQPRKALRQFVVIAPNATPTTVTAESWLVALGIALGRAPGEGPTGRVTISKADRTTWVVEELDHGHRFLVIDAER